MQNITQFLDLLIELVDDDSVNWEAKKATILAHARDREQLETALEEFTSWFEGEFEE